MLLTKLIIPKVLLRFLYNQTKYSIMGSNESQ